jgi:hypothetical protein
MSPKHPYRYRRCALCTTVRARGPYRRYGYRRSAPPAVRGAPWYGPAVRTSDTGTGAPRRTMCWYTVCTRTVCTVEGGAANQAYFLTSSTHTPPIDTVQDTAHPRYSPGCNVNMTVGSTRSITKLIARSRNHGFPLSLRLDGLRPAGHTLQLHKHTRRLTRTSPDLGRGACLSVCASHRVC